METRVIRTTTDVAESSGNGVTQTQTRGGARQEIRRSALHGSRAGEETAATATLGRSGEGRVRSEE
jgi:hypothetical protein